MFINRFFAKFVTLILKNSVMELPFSESYKIKMVEYIRKSTSDERIKWIKESKYNLFNLKSEQVYIDLLTDSGTGAMSDKQWSALMEGDESYAGSKSYFNLKNSVTSITGFNYFLPTHQGRAAENVLFSAFVKEGDIVPGNAHFDTTKGHIEFRKAIAIDCTIEEAKKTDFDYPFKGNVDLKKLEDILKNYPAEKIPFIIITLTNNTVGGQPVSLTNIKGVYALAKRYGGIKILFDSARFAENAYFIKQREEGYARRPVIDICNEMFRFGDFMTMSSKKDGNVNIGGFIGFRNEEDYKKCQMYNILYEGYITYGGMSGRDMNALATGLKEGIDFDYLETRIKQVEYFAAKLDEYGIPYQKPAGGHAIFVDAKRFLPHIPVDEFVAQTLAIELYIESGIRGVEVGTLLADKDPVTQENRYPDLEFLRLAIPRRVYTNSHMDYIAAALKNVYDRRDKIRRGYKIIKEAPIMRHFTVELAPK